MKARTQSNNAPKARARRHRYPAAGATGSDGPALRETSALAIRPADTASALDQFISAGAPPLRYLVLQGDAFDLIDDLPEDSIDLVLTSPPYWGLRTYDFEHDWEIGKAWKKAGHSIEDVPPYDWYRKHGGSLGLEPTPEWFVAHISEILCKLLRPLKASAASGSTWETHILPVGPVFARMAGKDLRAPSGSGENTDGWFSPGKEPPPYSSPNRYRHAGIPLDSSQRPDLVQTQRAPPSGQRPAPPRTRTFLPLRKAPQRGPCQVFLRQGRN